MSTRSACRRHHSWSRSLTIGILLVTLSWFSMESSRRWRPSSSITLTLRTTEKSPTRLPTRDSDRPRTEKEPPPLQMWRKYIQQHGNTALQRDYQSSDRRYLVAPYWCPDQPGHVLHNLWNSLAWAMLLNRTVLLRWDDTNSPGNTPEACRALLPTHPEIPLYKDWHARLDMNETDIFAIPLEAVRWQFDATLYAVTVPQIPQIFRQDSQKYYRNAWSDHPLSPDQPTYREYLFWVFRDNTERQAFLVKLLAYGIQFLYGLFLRHVFVLPTTVPMHISSGPQARNKSDMPSFSIALHSQHLVDSDDGSIVSDEVKCLKRLSSLSNLTLQDCTIYVLSGCRRTLSSLTDWIHQHAPACNVVTTRQDHVLHTTDTTKDDSVTGAEFIHELVMATSGTTPMALIGDSHQSSFALLHEMVIYDTFVNRLGLDMEQVEVPVCGLRPKSSA